MKTITAHAAKDLRIEDHPDPVCGADDLLIQIEVGGICGSDLHYYNHGGFGSVRLKEPMILGHEVAGRVVGIGSNVNGYEKGDLVAVSPSRPCYACDYCLNGQHNHCLNMRFYGSAMPMPHIQGAFREVLVADARQCVKANALTSGEAAMAEPLAVVLHAAKQAGDLMGQRVLVTGCGPIGQLAVLVARAAGAVEIVATDIADFPLDIAARNGADTALNVAKTPKALEPFSANKGHFDVLFECSGAAVALANAVPVLKPRATVVQLGLGGDMTLPVQAMTAKEFNFCGSFRFHHEFPMAVEMMAAGRIDVKSLISGTFPMMQAVQAFDIASDRTKGIKTQIAFRS
jgi:L-idonate 5-dehydrogenase